MSLPTTAEATIRIEAPPDVVYDLVTDVTRMGEWSPECRALRVGGPARCRGLDVQGPQPPGPARWTTVAKVEAADRPTRFAFHTLYKDGPSTRWSYRFEPDGDGATTVTESFEAITSPPLIAFAEKYILRNRQRQLEDGMAETLARIKAVAEALR